VPSTVYRRFGNIERQAFTPCRADKGVSRKVTEEEKRAVAKMVAAMKLETETKTGKVMRTLQVFNALQNALRLPKVFYESDLEISESTINRWLNEYGYSYSQVKNYREIARNRMRTDAPLKWSFVDASTSELFYLSGSKGRLVLDNSGIITDKNHREEILTSKGYKKITIFCAVDLYSRAYFIKGYVTPGESTLFWTRFLFDYMLEKSDPRNPIQGIPQNIYSDKGSALKSEQMREMFDILGINIVQRYPGNAKAKGIVERRIGAYKQ